MTETDLQSKLAECEDVIRQLVAKLEETVDENDRLRAELARLTEGASGYATLSDIHRNRDLPAAVRAKAAIGCLPHEPRLLPEKAAIDATYEEVIEPLADVVARQRARADRMLLEAPEFRALADQLKPGGNGNGSGD